MTPREQADLLIKTIKVWQFLQFVDERVERGDEQTRELVETFFARYLPPQPCVTIARLDGLGVLPLAQLKPSLAILQASFHYGWSLVKATAAKEWLDAGLSPPATYKVSCRGPKNPDITQLLRVLRNAHAHTFDRSPNGGIAFPAGAVVEFASTTKHGHQSVTFPETAGFLRFVGDYTGAVQRVAVARLRQAGPDG